MNEELEKVKKEIAALEQRHKELSLKKVLNDSEAYDLAQIPLILARLETRYNTLVQSLANAQTLEPINLMQVFKELIDFDSLRVNFNRPSITLDGCSTKDITYIVPLMKFVCREEPAKLLYNALDGYLNWKSNMIGESEKNIKFITVVGTSGKGKTTFARRFMDIPYSGKHSDIVNDCKACNRRYRVSCVDFDISKDPETQLSSLLLYEAFKYSIDDDLLKNFRSKISAGNLIFTDVLEVITKTFFTESSNQNHKKLLMILNLDETNALLNDKDEKKFLKNLFRILRNASVNYNLLTILSGTHSVDLFEQARISQCKFIDIDLSLIELDASKEVILGMTANPHLYHVSPHLEYLLTLCGGVGKYLEIAIIQMSIIGSSNMDGTVTEGFKLNAYEYFLDKLQTPQHIETLLEKLTTCVMSHYPKVFSKFAQSIELLSCYTLFQWPVQRETIINSLSISNLEKEGLVFLQPIPHKYDYICIIPFITLYWTIKYSYQNVQIPFLKDIKSYFSPEESENCSLHIVMLKLWGLVQKNKLSADKDGLCSIWLSELFPLRHLQADIVIRFRPLFKIMSSTQRINLCNYETFEKLTLNSECIAFLNAKGASFPDAVIFSNPRIGIQEKQSVAAKKRTLAGSSPSYFDPESYEKERLKFTASDIFVLITDEKAGDINFGPLDIFIDCDNFAEFSGPLIALRKLYCINELNESVKRLKLKK